MTKRDRKLNFSGFWSPPAPQNGTAGESAWAGRQFPTEDGRAAEGKIPSR